MTSSASDPRLKSWSSWDHLAIVVVTLIAAVLRLTFLSDPSKLVFDETYYAKDACLYVETQPERCKLKSPQEEAHPPLGKWLIGVGIAAFGFDSFGWRIASALAGSATVALMYMLGRKLLASTLGATLAAGLLALDFLHFVQSRIAMVDVFVALFGVAAVLFVLNDRDSRRPARPWLIAAGIASGAAFASKWAGAFFILIVVVLASSWSLSARRVAGQGHVVRRTLTGDGPAIVMCLILLPLVVYVATYIGRVEGAAIAAPWSKGSWLGAVAHDQHEMYVTHTRDLADATHSYQSPAWSWILLKRPVSYFFEVDANGHNQEILALGSPFVWWASIAAFAFALVSWVGKLMKRESFGGPEGVIVAGIALTYGPWLMQQTGRGAVFIFYLLPTVPFMGLALAYSATRIGNSWEARAAIAVFAATAIGLFAFFYPVLAKRPIPPKQWEARIWFDEEDCNYPKRPLPSATTETGPGGRTIIRTPTTGEENPPPEGWCWI